MMEVPPRGFKPAPSPVNPVLPRQETEVRKRASPFTWELSPGLLAMEESGPAPSPQPSAGISGVEESVRSGNYVEITALFS